VAAGLGKKVIVGLSSAFDLRGPKPAESFHER